ncbi:MAG: acetyl-CoA carboxylase biotin carboxyl carrier protein subunit [Bacteroidales bacterium]|nr:acetyl-CoA carboxylase biotin carboxyl carrier protein subunit [Bacteroidales bacterium]
MNNNVTDIQPNKKRMNYKSLLIENIKYRTLLTEKYKQRKPFEKKDEKILYTFIPGNIVEIFVKPNNKVQKGDKLLVLEAMKMKNEIVSPIDGSIKSIHVKVGDIVKKNEILFEFN